MPVLETDAARRALMQRVKQRGTPAERAVARACHQSGLRYRLNVKGLPGSPDIANKTAKWAIFVNGCFWHQHEGCRRATMPKTNATFWKEKFAANQKRDALKIRLLRDQGFRVLVVWECEAESADRLNKRIQIWAKRVS